MIPAHRNLANSQSGMLRQIKQFDIEGEPVEASCFQDWAAHIEAESLEPALGIPKRQTGRETHQQIERATSLLTSPRLVDAN
jgi:hypothetical protein